MMQGKQKKKTSWQILKDDPIKMKRYRECRRQYLSRKKQARTPKKSVYDVPIRYNGVIYNNVTDLLLTYLLVVDLQDDEILHIWKQLKDKVRVIPGCGKEVS